MLHHVVNEHEWALGDGVSPARCVHAELNEDDRQKDWLTPDSPSHRKLRHLMMDTRFVNTLKHYVNFR